MGRVTFRDVGGSHETPVVTCTTLQFPCADEWILSYHKAAGKGVTRTLTQNSYQRF